MAQLFQVAERIQALAHLLMDLPTAAGTNLQPPKIRMPQG
jgi:hypothetical protein